MQWAAATGQLVAGHYFPPPTWGRKGPEIRGSNGRDWTQGQGTTLHHPFIKLQLAAALPPNANHPRASTANSTVLARQARDENLTWGWGDECVYVPTYLRICVGTYPPTCPPSLRLSAPLVPLGGISPSNPWETTSLPVKYPRPHYNLRPDSRLLLDCNTSLSLCLACCSFWALHAPALLPLIPSFPLTNRLLLSTPLKSSKSHARSLFTIWPRNTHPLAVHHAYSR